MSDPQNASPSRLTLTVEEAAARLGISRGLAYEMVRQNQLPSRRLGRRIVIPLAQLLSFLEQPGASATLAVDDGHYVP